MASSMPAKFLFLLASLVLSASILADANWKESSNSEAAKTEMCVAPTPFMRRNHFELIKHQRDITVHQGIRKTDDSIAGCIACHQNYDDQGKALPVNAEDQFCAGCHEYVGASLDCFDCHSPVNAKSE